MTRATASRRGRLLLGAVGAVAVLVGAGVLVWPWVGTPGPWVDAWVVSPTSKVLMVRAAGTDGPAGQCGPPQVRFTVTESASAVRVTARYARLIPGPGACADVGYGPVPHAVTLREALGSRVVVDSTSEQRRPLLVASEAATIDRLPPRFATYDLARATIGGVGVVQRQWRGPGGFVLLTTQSRSSTRLLFHREVVRYGGIDVRFHVHEDEPRDVYLLEWRMPSGTRANVDLHLPHATWTPDRALAVVRSTRDATGR